MPRPATAQIAIISMLAEDQRRYTPSAIAETLRLNVRTVWTALDSLLAMGTIKASKYKKTGFVYRHPATPESAPLVEIAMVRTLIIDGRPVAFISK